MNWRRRVSYTTGLLCRLYTPNYTILNSLTLETSHSATFSQYFCCVCAKFPHFQLLNIIASEAQVDEKLAEETYTLSDTQTQTPPHTPNTHTPKTHTSKERRVYDTNDNDKECRESMCVLFIGMSAVSSLSRPTRAFCMSFFVKH